MHYSIQKWLHIALFNLLLIASLGFLLRYKIAFSLPFVDQKHLLHAHSHFAFGGWISQLLMALMVSFLVQRGITDAFVKYHKLLFVNLISAYGMLLSFPFQGYGLVSITFSTLSIINAYYFMYLFWTDLKKNNIRGIETLWFKSALIFNTISSFGAFSLAFMMANKIVNQNYYLIAVYFFLHFQYNGWFFFAIAGLWFSKLKALKINFPNEKIIFWLFAFACIPCYFLSILWLKIDQAFLLIVAAAALIQVIALYLFLKSTFQNLASLKSSILSIGVNLLSLSLLAFTIKISLQLASTMPSLNQLAYGFRPIVIGYLHLVLLGFVTLFLLGYAIANLHMRFNKMLINGALLFTSGIILNELFLMLQGVSAMQLISIPYINEVLFAIAILLVSGASVLLRSQVKHSKTDSKTD